VSKSWHDPESWRFTANLNSACALPALILAHRMAFMRVSRND
jgi:hypothetical protein